jgi:hypothetical protein
MKKACAVVFAIILSFSVLAACSGAPKAEKDPSSNIMSSPEDQSASQPESPKPEESPDPAPDAAASGTGSYTTTPEKLPLSLETPGTWMYVDPSIDDLERLTELLGNAGFAENILQQAKDSDVVFFYDTANYDTDFRTNMNILRQDAGSLDQSGLSGVAADLKAICERDFSQAPFEGFSWVMEPQGKTLGSNYYLVYISNYTAETPITGVMAITIYNNHLYQFTYSIPQSIYKDTMYADFERILSSVEFL